MPNTSHTPCATSVSTKASEGVIFCLPVTARRLASVMVFMASPRAGMTALIVAQRRLRHLGPASEPHWGQSRGARTPHLFRRAKLDSHHRFRRDAFVAQRLGHGLARHLAECDV